VLSNRVAARMEAQGEGLLLLVRETGSTRAEFALAAALKFGHESTGENMTPLQVCFRACRAGGRIGTPTVFSRGRTF
jgi:hypothetical protein